jgi:outer membrane protein assembly factor BamB
MYQMDALHTGRSQHTGPKQLRLLRSIDLTAPQLRPLEQSVVTSPDIRSSTVIGPDGTIYATTFAGWTYALKNSASATDQLELLWRFRPSEGGSPAHGSAAVAHDGTTVYVGYGIGTALNQLARLYALRPAGGNSLDAQVVWQTDVGDGTVANSPTLTGDGTIYFVNVNGLLSVIDPATGHVKWTAQTGSSGDAPFGQTLKVAPAVAPDGTVYTTAMTGSMYAIAPAPANGGQGGIKWSFDFGEHLGSTPLLTAPVTASGNRGQDGVGSAASVTIGPDGTLYVGANNSNFYALARNGQMNWFFEAERELGGIWSTAALNQDASALFFGANKGGVYALSTHDGGLRWRFPVEGSIYGSPALDAAGTLYIGGSAGHVYAINSVNGEQVADYNAGANVWTAPSIRPDGTVVVGTRAGRILVLG